MKFSIHEVLNSLSFGVGVAEVFEESDEAVAEVALDDDLSVFGTTPYPTLGLEGLAEGGKVVVGSNKAVNNGDGLASSAITLDTHAQFLLVEGQGVDFGRSVVLILEVGVGGIDHSYKVFVL